MFPVNLVSNVSFSFACFQMGALAVKSKGVVSGLDGDLTYLGRVAAHLPVDSHLAKFIVMGYLFGVLRESIIIGKIIYV